MLYGTNLTHRNKIEVFLQSRQRKILKNCNTSSRISTAERLVAFVFKQKQVLHRQITMLKIHPGFFVQFAWNFL